MISTLNLKLFLFNIMTELKRSMKIALPLILLFGLSCSLPERTIASKIVADTSVHHKPWKISQQQFLDQYGKDDTSRAVINYFFQQHKIFHKAFISEAIITTGLTGLDIFALVRSEGTAGVLVFAIFGSFALLFFYSISLRHANYLMVYSRKNLLKTLRQYFSGQGFSKKLKENIWKKHYFK